MSPPWPPTASVESPPSLDAKLQFLGSPAAHGSMSCDVEAIETHMSWVFLAGDRVLKLKRPVRYPFLDFSTIAAREFYCREELRLNTRLAPGVYLGLRALQWDGGEFRLLAPERLPAPGKTVDWLVLMRRLPEQRMLHRLIAQGQIAPVEIDEVVALLGRFYRDATVLSIPTQEYYIRFNREQASNRQVLLRPEFQLEHAELALDRLDRALLVHAELFRDRCERGRIVDGHGDLRPEHVCLIDPPVVIDCLEFDPLLRQVDPFDEVAFLGFECGLAGADWIAPRLVAGLSDALNDRPSPALINLYTARRAMLRARLALAHLLDARPRTPQRWEPLAQRCVQRALAAIDDLERCGSRGSAVSLAAR